MGNGFSSYKTNSPSTHLSSSCSTSSPTINIPDGNGNKNVLKDDDLEIVESCSTPKPKLTQPSFDLTKVKLENGERLFDPSDCVTIEDEEAPATNSVSEASGHVSISTQTTSLFKKELDNTDDMTERNREAENHSEMEPLLEQASTSSELRTVKEDPMKLNNNSVKLDQKSNNVQVPDQLTPNIPQVKPEAKFEDMALNVADAQQQQDNLMELLEAAAKERDESRTEQHRLILEVADLQTQLVELKQDTVKKEQNHQSIQTSPEMIEDYKVQYLEAKEQIKQLQLELDELKKRERDKESKEALAAVDDEVACQIDLLLRELDERNKKQEELMKKVSGLDWSKSS